VEAPGTGIAATGLQPRFGGTGAATADPAFVAQSKGKVHYTRKPKHAERYRQFIEGSPDAFEGVTHSEPGPAETLLLSIHADAVKREEQDPADRYAKTTSEAIKPESIKRLKPASIPPSGQKDELGWREHQQRGLTSLQALKSNLPPESQLMVDKLVDGGADESAVLQMVKQGLMAKVGFKG
jgi:hypothetical protein